MPSASSVFRTGSSRALAGAVIALCVLGVAFGLVRSGLGTLWTVGPWAAAIAVTIWAVYWRPRIVVDDDAVTLVNIVRTIRIPWDSIRSVDTRWTLTLVTDGGRFGAWASPGPGGLAKVRASQRADRDARLRGNPFAGRAAPVVPERYSAADVIRQRLEHGGRLGGEPAPEIGGDPTAETAGEPAPETGGDPTVEIAGDPSAEIAGEPRDDEPGSAADARPGDRPLGATGHRATPEAPDGETSGVLTIRWHWPLITIVPVLLVIAIAATAA